MLPRSWRLVDAVALLLGALCAALVRAFSPSRPLPRTFFVYSHRGLNQVSPVVNSLHDRVQEVFALQAKKSNAGAPVDGASSSSKSLRRSRRGESEAGGVTRQTPFVDYNLAQTRRKSTMEVADPVPTVSLNTRITSPGHLKVVSHDRYLALLESAVRLHDKKIKTAARQKGSKRSRTDTSPFALATEVEWKKCTMDHDVKEAEPIRNDTDIKLMPNKTMSIMEDSPTASHLQKKRRSKYFWSDAENTRKEIATFWERLGVVSDKVPNNTLLTHFRVHGLRHAIQCRGGRDALARWLGVEAIPGRWTQALQTDEVAKLVRDGTLGSNFMGPNKGGTPLVGDAHKKWPSQATNLRAYWQQNLHVEVAAFAEMFQGEAGLPVVWLPRMVDMSKAGRRDIENAVQRFGGYDAVVSRMGMVHHMEWRFFMDQLETLRELKKCLTLNGEVTKVMPRKRTLLERKKTTLVEGLVKLGGVELVARKMGLAYSTPSSHGYPDGMLFGKFDLTFAVDLLEFVFHREYDRSPVVTHDARRYPQLDGKYMSEPWKYPVNIMMPSIKELEDAGHVGRALLAKIVEYGGVENVGRRLYLGWSGNDERKCRLMILQTSRQVIHNLLLGQQRKLLKERSGLLEQLEIEARREAQIAMERKQEALKLLAQQRQQLRQHEAHRKMAETVHGSALIGPGRASLPSLPHSDERVRSSKTKARNARKS